MNILLMIAATAFGIFALVDILRMFAASPLAKSFRYRRLAISLAAAFTSRLSSRCLREILRAVFGGSGDCIYGIILSILCVLGFVLLCRLLPRGRS